MAKKRDWRTYQIIAIDEQGNATPLLIDSFATDGERFEFTAPIGYCADILRALDPSIGYIDESFTAKIGNKTYSLRPSNTNQYLRSSTTGTSPVACN